MRSAVTLPGTLDALEAVARFVRTAAVAAGLDPQRSYRLRLAVDELVTNIVKHGYCAAGRSGTVRVTAELSPMALVVTIEDNGATFDPNTFPQPSTLSAPPHERDPGGLGIFLALRGVDDFAYETTDSGNRSRLTVNRCFQP